MRVLIKVRKVERGSSHAAAYEVNTCRPGIGSSGEGWRTPYRYFVEDFSCESAARAKATIMAETFARGCAYAGATVEYTIQGERKELS